LDSTDSYIAMDSKLNSCWNPAESGGTYGEGKVLTLIPVNNCVLLDIGDIKVRIKNVDEKCNFDDLDKTYEGSRVLAPGKL